MIQPTSNYLGYNRTDATPNSTSKPPTVAQSPMEKGDNLSSSQTQNLREALSNTPEVRPEVVERGRRLAVDPNYPPRELILRLAKLMTEASDPSEQS